jgi:hypothetical protein
MERPKRQRTSVNYSQARLEEAHTSTPVWLAKDRRATLPAEAAVNSGTPAKENAEPPGRKDVSAGPKPKGRKARSMDARALKQSREADEPADHGRTSDPTEAEAKPSKAGKHAQKGSAAAEPAPKDRNEAPAPAPAPAPAVQPSRRAQQNRSKAAPSPAVAAAALAASKSAAAEATRAATAGEKGAAERSKRRSSSTGDELRNSGRKRGRAERDADSEAAAADATPTSKSAWLTMFGTAEHGGAYCRTGVVGVAKV